jgi:hypothetical protein
LPDYASRASLTLATSWIVGKWSSHEFIPKSNKNFLRNRAHGNGKNALAASAIFSTLEIQTFLARNCAPCKRLPAETLIKTQISRGRRASAKIPA